MHDDISYVPCSAGMVLLLDLLEHVANGTLADWHATPDERTGLDGVDEVTEAVLVSESVGPYDQDQEGA